MSATAQRVSFVIAGAQKAGTSALFEYLREVPGLQLPAVKEAHFFDDDVSVDWGNPDYSPYHALFEDDGRMWGEATPIYCYWPNAAERMQRYNPAMKLILLLRDPVERAWSHWQMEYARGAEAQPFGWCIREGRARMNQARPYPGYDRVASYIERGFYGAQLAHLLTLFPAAQVFPLQSRDLSESPNPTIVAICRFLGIDPPVGPIHPRRVRVAREMGYPSTFDDVDVSYLQQIYHDDRALLTTLLQAMA